MWQSQAPQVSSCTRFSRQIKFTRSETLGKCGMILQSDGRTATLCCGSYNVNHICSILWVVPSLTHWGREKMDAISQNIFSRAFSSMKIVVFWSKFHWNLFARIQLTIIRHWFRWWPGADQATSHYLNQWWLIYRRIYALGLNELSKLTISKDIPNWCFDQKRSLLFSKHGISMNTSISIT